MHPPTPRRPMRPKSSKRFLVGGGVAVTTAARMLSVVSAACGITSCGNAAPWRHASNNGDDDSESSARARDHLGQIARDRPRRRLGRDAQHEVRRRLRDVWRTSGRQASICRAVCARGEPGESPLRRTCAEQALESGDTVARWRCLICVARLHHVSARACGT